jgi:hypothetical protein
MAHLEEEVKQLIKFGQRFRSPAWNLSTKMVEGQECD